MKQTFAEKLAKRRFQSELVQNDREVHMRAFGVILAPAFSDSYSAKLCLNKALSALSNQRVKAAGRELKKLQAYCKTDADFAAWEFCMGLCCETDGDTDGMISHFTKAGEYGHRFYLVDMKIAKAAHNAGSYEKAAEHYRRALELFEETQVRDERQRDIIRASVYTNLASCLTMLFRYEEAQEMLCMSKEIAAVQTGRAVTEAVLYAAMGQRERVEACLRELDEQMPEMVDAVRQTAEDIFEGRHEHFKNR